MQVWFFLASGGWLAYLSGLDSPRSSVRAAFTSSLRA